MDITADITGWIALVVIMAGLAMRDDRLLRWSSVVGCSLWVVHFALLGAWSPAGMVLLAAVMVGASMAGRHRLATHILHLNGAMVPGVILLVVLGHAGPKDILPVLAGLVLNTALMRCSGGAMTAVIALGMTVNLAAAILFWSVPAIASNALNLLALIVRTILRARHARRGDALRPRLRWVPAGT